MVSDKNVQRCSEHSLAVEMKRSLHKWNGLEVNL